MDLPQTNSIKDNLNFFLQRMNKKLFNEIYLTNTNGLDTFIHETPLTVIFSVGHNYNTQMWKALRPEPLLFKL